MSKPRDAADCQALNNFKEYLRIPSVQPNVNYEPCVAFLKRQAEDIGLPVAVYETKPCKPVVVITWKGKEPSLPSILLNSHMDVVPVYEKEWTHKPFAAETVDGKIYARGSQDMKCVGMQYLEAVKRLKRNCVALKRTVHISFVPDEEIGGVDGMKAFVQTKSFKDLNVGFALDEACASPVEDFFLFYAERSSWKVRFHCTGQPGHGSMLIENTAAEKVTYLLNRIQERRVDEQRKLRDNPQLNFGDVMAINVTQLNGGVQSNVIPSEIVLVIDCRVPLTEDVEVWEATLNRWCKEAGDGVWLTFDEKDPQLGPTKLDDTNPYWLGFKKGADEAGIKLKSMVCPGGTDGRYLREIGLPALGFSPINNTDILLHGNDEYLGEDVFLRGIEIYSKIIPGIANM